MNCLFCKQELPDDAIYCCRCGRKQTVAPRRRTRGEGSIYKHNGAWRAQYTLPWSADGKRHYKTKSGFKTRKEAAAWLAEAQSGKAPIRDITLAALHDAWHKSHVENLSKSKQYSYATAWKRLEPLWYRNIATINTADMQKLIDGIPGGYYPKRDVKSVLAALFSDAMANDYVQKDYTAFLKLPRQEPSKRDAYTRQEREQLWQAYRSGDTVAGYALVMIYTGLRPGELLKLPLSSIHPDERYMIEGIKTDAGKDRIIPIAACLMPVLRDLMAQAEGTKLIPLYRERFYDSYRTMSDRLGLRPLTPHCCRHTCATALAEAGIQPAVIKAIMGHTDYSTTIGYTHISLSAMLDSVDAL